MDKDQNWERTARAYTMLVHAEGERAFDAVSAIRSSFLRGINDEFIATDYFGGKPGMPIATVKNGDAMIFFNHRADRMRQLVKSLANERFGRSCLGCQTTTRNRLFDRIRPHFWFAARVHYKKQANVLAEDFCQSKAF